MKPLPYISPSLMHVLRFSSVCSKKFHEAIRPYMTICVEKQQGQILLKKSCLTNFGKNGPQNRFFGIFWKIKSWNVLFYCWKMVDIVVCNLSMKNFRHYLWVKRLLDDKTIVFLILIFFYFFLKELFLYLLPQMLSTNQFARMFQTKYVWNCLSDSFDFFKIL